MQGEWWVCVAGAAVAAAVAVAGRRRSGALVAIGLVVTVVGLRAHQDIAGLDRPLPARLAGEAELAADPQPRRFGTEIELVAAGRRWIAQVGRPDDAAVLRLRSGDRVHVTASVSALADWQAHLRSRHVAGRLSVRRITVLDGTRPWYAAANWFHERLARGASSFGDDARSLYLGLVVGDDRLQSELTAFRFRASGLTHLLAVSGQNVAFLLAVLAPAARRVTIGWRAVLSAVALVAFVLVTRAEPSVLRAAAMAGLALTAATLGRRSVGLRALALAVCALLAFDPLLAHSVGFRLSVGATLGLLVAARPLSTLLPGPRWIRDPLAVTVAAQAGALPVMAATFGEVPVGALPANVLAEPAAAGVMTCGMVLGVPAGLLREELAGVLVLPSRILVGWIDGVAGATARLAVAPLPAPAWLTLVGACGVGAALWRRGGRRACGRALAAPVVVAVALLRPGSPPAVPRPLPGGTVVADHCGRAVVELEDRHHDEGGAAEVLEALWRAGITRAAAVTGGRGPGPQVLARTLGAGPVGAEGTPCRLTG